MLIFKKKTTLLSTPLHDRFNNTLVQTKKPNTAVLFYRVLFTHSFHLINQIKQLNTNESRPKTRVQYK